jgi:hypothetical protein
VELPFTLKYYNDYTRVVYVLENGMIAMHPITTSRTSPATMEWIATCDVPNMSTLFRAPKYVYTFCLSTCCHRALTTNCVMIK